MMRLKLWQWFVLATPIATIVTFLVIAAGLQIHQWGLSWIWGVFTLIFVAWQWLLVKWTRPVVNQIEVVMADIRSELESAVEKSTVLTPNGDIAKRVETVLQQSLKETQSSPPIWEDWQTFWQQCQNLVAEIAHIYHPEVKYPLLNIYVPQAYMLVRGTVDDLDRWMQKLSPILNQVSVGQVYQAFEVYRQLEPSARKLWRAWNWAQWFLNPVAAVAKTASRGYAQQANQQLLVNLSKQIREVALTNLCRQAIALYGGSTIPVLDSSVSSPTLVNAKTQTLQEILAQAEPAEAVEQKAVNIMLVGRTGSGKSSLINTLFQAEKAAVDVLPSTDQIQNYLWQAETLETLSLWDTPGYEQVNRTDLRQMVLDYATKADLLILVTPALDPALLMDIDFLRVMKETVTDLPVIAVVTQVDRLRPIREWDPPYDWQWGDRPKEVAIREATQYRIEQLGDCCDFVLPIVTADAKTNRSAWGVEALSLKLVEAIAPAKQLRLARFLRNQEARATAAAKIIDHYTFQMTTTKGLTALIKKPILHYISTVSTGVPSLAYLLEEKIPVEQVPVVVGKLQMAYEIYSLLSADKTNKLNIDLLSLSPLLLENSSTPDRNAWAFGHALIEFWTQNLTTEELRKRFEAYLEMN